MASPVTVQMTGGKELVRKLKRLDQKVRKRIARKALRGAANPIRDDAKANVPVAEGKLKRSLRTRVQVSSRTQAAFVEARWPMGAHAHLVEFGTVERVRKSGGSTGAMPAQPFLRPAFDRHVRTAPAIMGRIIDQELRAEARKP